MYNKLKIETMKRKYLILTIFIFLGLFLNAQENLLGKQFYYYKGERFYLEIDYSRISIISEGKLNTEDLRESVNALSFNILEEDESHEKQVVMPLNDVLKKTQNKEIFITEIEFPEILEKTDYHKIILEFSGGHNVIKVMPTYIVSGQRLGISNNFYVKLFKENDRKKLLELAEEYSV